MALITSIYAGIVILLAVIFLFWKPTTVHRHFNPPGPENEKEDPDPPEIKFRTNPKGLTP